jgi:hypothetical protein
MASELASLSPRQQALLGQWLPGAAAVRDHGWGLVETTVLELAQAGSRFIVKAGGGHDHHIEREIRAHLNWLLPWTSRCRAPVLEHSDTEAKILVTRYLPGELVLGTEHASVPAAVAAVRAAAAPTAGAPAARTPPATTAAAADPQILMAAALLPTRAPGGGPWVTNAVC